LTAGRGTRSAQIVLLLTLLGAALRFGTLNVQSIWLDESATIILVHRGFSGMLSHLSSSESTPPLYYILVWGWTKIFGAGPIGFRSFSALAGTMTIPLMYAAGKQISPRVGICAAALATVNPAMYYYSQEARCYALLILFSAAAYVLWQRALRIPDGRRLALWAGMSILAVLTHYFAAFLFIPETVVLVRRLGWRRVRAPVGAVVLAGFALLPLAISQRADGKASWIEEASLASRIGETGKQFLIGLYGPVEIIAAFLAGLFAFAAIVLLTRRADRDERAGARDAALVAIAGIALPLLLAVTHVLDIFDGRNVIAAWIPFAVLLAVGVGTRRAPRFGPLLCAGLCALSIALVLATNALSVYQRDDWRGVAEALPAPASARTIVSEQFASLPLSIYLGSLTRTGELLATRELDFVGLRTRRTGRSPDPPVVPTTPLSGFRLAEVHRTKAYAVSRFVAPKSTLVRVGTLRHLIGDPKAEVVLQR
jgi:mannosyltransferase